MALKRYSNRNKGGGAHPGLFDVIKADRNARGGGVVATQVVGVGFSLIHIKNFFELSGVKKLGYVYNIYLFNIKSIN